MSDYISAGERRYWLISLILSCVGGFADSASYIVAGSFTGHITGNAILLTVRSVSYQWPQALSSFLAVIAFLVGTAAGNLWPHPPHRSVYRRLAHMLPIEIGLVAIGIAALAFPFTGEKNVFLISLCLALGLQNGAVGRIEAVSFHTTFITGLSTTLIGAIVAGKPSSRRRLIPVIIGCFVVGALVGALAATHLGIAGFIIALTMLFLAWLLAITAPSSSQAANGV